MNVDRLTKQLAKRCAPSSLSTATKYCFPLLSDHVRRHSSSRPVSNIMKRYSSLSPLYFTRFLPLDTIRRARYCQGNSSVRLSVCSWRWGIVIPLEYFENNFTADWPRVFFFTDPQNHGSTPKGTPRILAGTGVGYAQSVSRRTHTAEDKAKLTINCLYKVIHEVPACMTLSDP